MSSLIQPQGYLLRACGGGAPPRPKPAPEEEHEPLIRVEPEPEPVPEEDPDYNKKSGPGAGGGYVVNPDSVDLSREATRPPAGSQSPPPFPKGSK